MRAVALLRTIRPVLLLIATIWIVELLNHPLDHKLNYWFGLEPRRIEGLIGIPTMPLLHQGFRHTAANTVPLGILGAIGLLVTPLHFWRASLIIVVGSGVSVWLLARDGVIVGSSGLIFGWFGFLVTLGVLERSPRAVAGMIAVILLYGGTVWRVLPQQDATISWEAHLLGAITGAATAYFMRRRGRR